MFNGRVGIGGAQRASFRFQFPALFPPFIMLRGFIMGLFKTRTLHVFKRRFTHNGLNILKCLTLTINNVPAVKTTFMILFSFFP